jgi:adenine deaminase
MRNLLPFALGKTPCELILRNVAYLDVFSATWIKGDVAIAGGRIVGLDFGLKAIREINCEGKWLVPGFIDAHVHVESSLVTPRGFQKSVLPKGTTTAICDPHELTNVLGVRALDYFLNEASDLHLNLQVMLSSCVPATHLETNGGGVVSAKDLLPFKSHPKALGLAEMMNVPGVLHGDESVHEKLEAFSDRVIDGHAPLLRGHELSAYVLCGISSCHESSELEEAREKLTKGIAVWIREGSVAKDLHALLPLLTPASSLSLGFCTDDRNPLDIASEGHIDYLLREAIRLGADPTHVFRAASLSVAVHYDLHRGPERIGAIAPGFIADLVLLDDVKTVAIHSVFKAGKNVHELEVTAHTREKTPNTVFVDAIQAADLQGDVGLVNVIRVLPGKIITEHEVANTSDSGIAKLTVLERHGKKSKPANAYVSGFGENFTGAIASSVGHDSHNLICAGSNTKDMQVALTALTKNGGGFCVVKNGAVIAELALPLGGLMSLEEPEVIEKGLRGLRAASASTGCVLAEPFLQLAFLSLPVIPKLKLTDMGLVDVDQFKIIPVRV